MACFRNCCSWLTISVSSSAGFGIKVLVQGCKEPRHNNIKVGSSCNLEYLWANRWRGGAKSCAQDRWLGAWLGFSSWVDVAL